MRRRSLIVPLVLAALACGRHEEPVDVRGVRMPPAPTESQPEIDADNLLNLAYGASAISRTAEATLEQSAVHAVDGISETAWWSPPGGGNQELVFSLPAPARVERLGVTSSSNAPTEVRFDASLDGEAWREIASMSPDPDPMTQLIDIDPAEVQYLRVRVLDAARYYISLRSIHLLGTEIAPPPPRSLEGCWIVNGEPASIAADGVRVTGGIGTDRVTFLDGAYDGRVARLMWSRGPMFGYAAVTPGAGGATLSGVTFHEEAVIEYAGAAWFGRRESATEGCTPSPSRPPHEEILERAGRWSMFGLVFGEGERLDLSVSQSTLDALSALLARGTVQRSRIVAHEFRGGSSEENRRRASARIEQLRSALRSRDANLSGVEFVAAGSDRPPGPISSAVQRLLASRIDFEARP